MTNLLNKIHYLFLIIFITCSGQEKMNRTILNTNEARQVYLAKKLNEISGIVFSQDRRLFAHDDERAVIYQINPQNGDIIKTFYFGMMVKRGDFEDIAIVGNDFYMVTGNGLIYKFPEGADGQQVDYEAFNTPLSKGHDVEGLCYDKQTNSLLLALKGNPGNGFGKSKKAVYSFSLKTNSLDTTPRFILDRKELRKYSVENDFAPSGIARNPESGNFFVIASKGNLIIEINKQGFVVSVDQLDKRLHKQPEGISFFDGKTLYISDEGKRQGTLTRYSLE